MKKLTNTQLKELERLCQTNNYHPGEWKALVNQEGFVKGKFKDKRSPIEVIVTSPEITIPLLLGLQLLLQAEVNVDKKLKDGSLPLELVFDRKDNVMKYLMAVTLIRYGATLNGVSSEKVEEYKKAAEVFLLPFHNQHQNLVNKIMEFFQLDTPEEEIDSAIEVDNPVLDVIDGLYDEEKRNKVVVEFSTDDSSLADTLFSELDWTAYKLSKINRDDVNQIVKVYEALPINNDHNLKAHDLQPEVQKALLNIMIYTGKLLNENENAASPKEQAIQAKTSKALLLIKKLINADTTDALMHAAEDALKEDDLTQNRGSGFYWIHGLFARKRNTFAQDRHHYVRSTIEELVLDLHTALSTGEKPSL